MQRIAAVCLGIILLAFVSLVFTALISYDGLVGSLQDVNNQWRQVSSACQQRWALAAKLRQTLENAADFDKSALADISQACASAADLKTDPNQAPTDAGQFRKFQDAQDRIASGLSRLREIVERSPELKASASLRDLLMQIRETENQIAVERSRFNELVRVFNVRVKRFPVSVIAGPMGFTPRPTW